MRKEILALFTLVLILVSVVATIHMVALPIITPVVLASPNSNHREVWKIIEVTNTHENMTTGGDVKVTVSSSYGVDVSWSTNITEYFRNIAYWNGTLGYKTCMEWLNGTSTLPYHWGDMDWYVSEGSLTSITWDEIKYWWDMYSDTGGSVSYETFMGNTYMADGNLTDPGNDPDIVGVVPWNGSNITVKDLVVPANMTVHIAFKIVITEPSSYAFDLTSPNPLLEISPSHWVTGGVGTLVVGKGPAYEYNTIQAAMNDAGPGDTIIVATGTYNEQVRFTKAVTVTSFTGESVSGGVVIDPNGAEFEGPVSGHMVRAAVTFEAGSSGALLRGVTIENSYASDYISGNQGGNSGIEVIDGGIDNVVVQNVNVSNVAGHGFGSYDTNHPWPPPAGWLIDNCSFSTTDTDTWSGMRPENMDNLIIQDCDVGPTNYGGILLINVNNSVVQRNKVHNTVRAGIQVDSYCTGVIDVIDNEVWVTNSANAADYGDVRLYGQYVPDPHGDPAATVTIQGNLLHDGYNGLCVKTGQDISTRAVVVYENNIWGHSNYGVLNAGTGTLDAMYNWWGNETGPYHSTLNPTGLGDNMSSNVKFKPWLVEPFPPAVPVTELYVSPELTQCWSGLNETFEVKVTLDNVKLLYGFDVELTWNSTLLNLTLASYSELWGAYPDTYPWQNTINNTLGKYHLALSGTGDVTPFDGSATLATLTFSITSEPAYPTNFTSDLAFVDTLLTSTKNLTEPEPILHVVYNGTYMCNSTLPKISLGESIYIIERTPYEAGATKKFDVDIKVMDVVNLEAFDFNLTYDPYLLKFGNEWQIHVACVNGWVVWNDTQGSVFGHANGISPLVNGTSTLATVKFQVRRGFVWNTVNSSRSCSLEFSYTNLTRSGNVAIEHEAINGTYRYKPVPGDLDMSGNVDILDLSAAAHAFGLSSGDPGWDEYWFANVYVDDTINILDIVIIARNFGRTEPEP